MSGINRAPDLMLSACAMSGPDVASASVATNGSQCTVGNQTTLAAACAGFMFHSRATIEAPAATTATRRYCMKATRRASAPWASASTIMAVAAPGLDPHNTAVPGKMCMRVISQPRKVLAAITASTPNTKTGQRLRISPAMASGAMAAIMQPMRPCASRKAALGTRAVPPLAAIAIPANMGPNSRAAGIRSQANRAPMTAEAARIASHCPGDCGRLAVAGGVSGGLTDPQPAQVRFRRGAA